MNEPKSAKALEVSKRSRRHPLFGWMKGTLWTAPGVDLTAPACPEWSDIAEESCAELARMLHEQRTRNM
jgi:hypothetical protein